MLDTTDFLTALAAITGEAHVLTAADRIAGYMIDVRRSYEGQALCVVEPADTAEVSAIMALCNARGVPVTPIGGNTGLVGGAAVRGKTGPDGVEIPGIGLSLRRLNRIRDISVLDETMTVEAGCVLQALQETADAQGMYFPLSLSSEGSCQIGGNIATNAGGTAAIRYGVTRHLVLGLEVVLPSGEVLDGLTRLRKDNTGYDIRQLFIGSEGTLGVITAAVMKIAPAPLSRETALVAVESVDDALVILRHMKAAFGERVTSAEITEADYIRLILREMKDARMPFETVPRWTLLLEVCDGRADADLRGAFEEALAAALEEGHARDAVIAQNAAQAEDFWFLRHAVSDAIRHAGPNMSHDSSVPLEAQQAYVDLTRARIVARFPEALPLYVGHMGDGNMHLVVMFAKDRFADRDAYMEVSAVLDEIIDGVVAELKGSITAEHGIGLSYRGRLAKSAQPVEIALMKGIKAVFDPNGIMNPSKLFL
ncbi:FAD-binding oxidoreductase [Acidimangrovimonas sediminis]|uniref:FAD-binding oxidoreductase n=1 Tax=Acidimangrovimonas sediminis TaxID=2056283 RepID=UPI0013049E76|nr:FAD-binding oxidoreductase [Acidimangrovimonas sediminis]